MDGGEVLRRGSRLVGLVFVAVGAMLIALAVLATGSYSTVELVIRTFFAAFGVAVIAFGIVVWRDAGYPATWNDEGISNMRLPRTLGKGRRLVATPTPWNAVDHIDVREARDPQNGSILWEVCVQLKDGRQEAYGQSSKDDAETLASRMEAARREAAHD